MGPKRQKGQKCEFLPTDQRSHMWPLGREDNFIILLYNPYYRITLYKPQHTKQKERCFLQKTKPLPCSCLSMFNKEKRKKKKKEMLTLFVYNHLRKRKSLAIHKTARCSHSSVPALSKKKWVKHKYCTLKPKILLVTLDSSNMNRDTQNHLFPDAVHSLPPARTEIEHLT